MKFEEELVYFPYKISDYGTKCRKSRGLKLCVLQFVRVFSMTLAVVAMWISVSSPRYFVSPILVYKVVSEAFYSVNFF